jgi:tetratricopeptide (TPR) repeat protein
MIHLKDIRPTTFLSLRRSGKRPFRRPKWLFNFFAGLPAVATLATLALMVVVRSDPDRLADRYLFLGERHREAGEYKDAMLCLRRASELRLLWPQPRFDMVLTLDAAGRRDEAEELATRLAQGRTGHPPAQLWLARRLLQQSAPSAPEVAEAEGLLLRFTHNWPWSDEGRTLLAALYATQGRPGLARPHLEAVLEQQPEILFSLARIDTASGRQQDAEVLLQAAEQKFRSVTQRDIDDSVARRHWAEAAFLLGKTDEAEEILRQGLLLNASDKILGRVMASLRAYREGRLNR